MTGWMPGLSLNQLHQNIEGNSKLWPELEKFTRWSHILVSFFLDSPSDCCLLDREVRPSLHCTVVCCIFRSTLQQSRPNKAGLKCPSVKPSVRPSIHKKFLRLQWNLACRQRSMSDARRYAVWPDPRSRSRVLWSRKSSYFQMLSSLPFRMGAGNWPLILKLGTISKFDRVEFFNLS